MAETDLQYYRRRAGEELDRAGSAGHPEAARVHQAMAARYLDLAERADPSEPGRLNQVA